MDRPAVREERRTHLVAQEDLQDLNRGDGAVAVVERQRDDLLRPRAVGDDADLAGGHGHEPSSRYSHGRGGWERVARRGRLRRARSNRHGLHRRRAGGRCVDVSGRFCVVPVVREPTEAPVEPASGPHRAAPTRLGSGNTTDARWGDRGRGVARDRRRVRSANLPAVRGYRPGRTVAAHGHCQHGTRRERRNGENCEGGQAARVKSIGAPMGVRAEFGRQNRGAIIRRPGGQGCVARPADPNATVRARVEGPRVGGGSMRGISGCVTCTYPLNSGSPIRLAAAAGRSSTRTGRRSSRA